MNATWLAPMLTAGLFGSVHCIGMCGGLIAVASDGASSGRQRLQVQLGYQAARLVSYVALGAVAGWLGHALDLAGRAAGLGRAAAVVAGVSMMLWGLSAMLEAAGVGLKRWLPMLRLPPVATRLLVAAARRPPFARALLLGGASALLPCGFLYAFALAAAATGNPLDGGLVMAALWLGNLPALLGFGLVFAGAISRLRRHIPLLSAATVFALGVLTLNSRLNLPAFAMASISGGSSGGPTAAQTPMAADCPCHRRRAR